MAAGISAGSQVIALLILGPPSNRSRYSAINCRAVRGAAAQLALLLENARLTGRIVEQEKLRRELELASEVQRRLFPQNSPESAIVQLAGMCLPARGVGGDYYDFLELGNGQIGFALADIGGKGIAPHS